MISETSRSLKVHLYEAFNRALGNQANNKTRRRTGMLAYATPYAFAQKSSVFALLPLSLVCLMGIVSAMSKSEDNQRKKTHNYPSPSERFSDFLDGYICGFDMYPVCGRQVYINREPHALLKAFWAVGSALNASTQEIIINPKTSANSSLTSEDEIRKRRIETARKAIEAIRQTGRTSNN